MVTKRKLKKEDLFKIQSITNPQFSPSEKEAVFLNTFIDEKEDQYYNHLYYVNVDSNEVVQWTFEEERISNPKWSPDGKQVAFISNRNEKNQLYMMNKSGGEAKKITDLEEGIQSFLWSPCGEKIWFTSSLKEGATFSEKAKKEEEKEKLEAYPVHKMRYKMDGVKGHGLVKQKVSSQIGIVSLKDNSIQHFSEGKDSYSLNDISPDGKKLIIGIKHHDQPDYEFNNPLFIIDVETKNKTVLVDQEGYYGGAKYSYDGRYIAYVGSDATYKNATHSNVFIYDTETELTQNLTESIDSPVGDYAVADVQQGVAAPDVVWTRNNDLYFQLSTTGDVQLYYASLDGAVYPATPEGEHVYDYTISKNGQIALVCVSNPVSPGELYKVDIAKGERNQITHFNDEWLDEVELVKPESFYYTSTNDVSVQGWLMKPSQFKDGEKYPLIVEIHGGPHTMYANTFFHEMQLLAAQGYGVLYVNPRGSHGYSQTFVDAVRGDYGGGDYEDIMAGLDEVLREHSWIDADRLGVTGGSYGGFMTNWIVGHTNRFKAAVTQRSISNWISFFGVSDIGYYFTPWQIGADMTDPEKLWHHSPLKYAKNIETPLLILHSELDFRCPIEQAEQLFITLKSMGKETSFVRFPDNNHNLSRTGTPSLRIERLNQIVTWFKNYL